MKHRGTARKRILTVHAETPLPPPGTMLAAGGQEIGEMLAAEGAEGFALVRLDRWTAADGPVTAGEIAVALTRPAWLDPAHGA
jgi:folate-binding Fe-S cluster repair protein YgfZ